MAEKKPKADRVKPSGSERFRVQLPGFVNEEEVGLGDVVKRVTYAMGIKPCAGCQRRAAALNRWIRFTR